MLRKPPARPTSPRGTRLGRASSKKGRSKPKNVVVIGGGTGTFTVLSGLKNYPVNLCAVVTIADSGGSSGVLRDEFGVLPPGDVRQALLALASDKLNSQSLRQLFSFRFENGRGLAGHSIGNLLLTALGEITGSPDRAIEEAGKLLGIKGAVLPVSLTNTHLCARLEDGTIIKGETNIDIRRVRPDLRIIDVFLDPPAKIHSQAKRAIREADFIIIGPGDLYTSIIPNLLVAGIPQAIASSRAKIIYVANLMTKHGETDGFCVADFVEEIKRYLGPANPRLKFVLANRDFAIPKRLLSRYRKGKEKGEPVGLSRQKVLAENNIKLVIGSFALAKIFFRHDSKKLARALMRVMRA